MEVVLIVTLYEKDASTFNDNGLCILSPSSCVVTEVAGGEYELELEHPLDDNGKYLMMTEERIIKASVPPTVIPAITLSMKAAWRVITATNLVSKTPNVTYEGRSWVIINIIQQNPSRYTWDSKKLYNIGAFVAYDNGAWRATKTNMNVEPDDNSTYWDYLGALSSSEPTDDTGSVIKALAVGDYVYKIADKGTYMQAKTQDGYVGFVLRSACSTTSELISDVVPAQTITEQLFRIYSAECDESTNTYTVKARHISYDFMSNCLYDCKVTEVSPNEAIAAIQGSLAIDDSRLIVCNITGKKITEDWSFKNPINALLDPDIGLTKDMKAKLIRNNKDFYILDDSSPRQGITIAYGVNMLGVNWNRSIENVVTRVIPRSGSSDKGYKYISNGGRIHNGVVQNQGKKYVESEIADEYAVQRIMVLDCSYAVGQQYEAADGSKKKYTEQEVLAKMLTDAKEKFTKDHVDGVQIELDVEFLLLGDTEEYKQYKGLQTVCLYDVIKVKTGKSGIDAFAQVTEYEWDSLRNRYNSIKLGTVNSFKKRVPGYRFINGSVTYEKLAPELIDRIITNNASASTDSGSAGYAPGGGGYLPYVPNTRDDDGVVLKGYGNASKVWKTDENGNPAWRDEVSGNYIPYSEKGVADGVASLDEDGKVHSNQLPSYVNDVEEYASFSAFPATGESGKIYVALDTGFEYRWSGTIYSQLSKYDVATQSASGLMSSSDKTKLDGIETGANKTTVENVLTSTSTTNALSAAMGKALNDNKVEKIIILNNGTNLNDVVTSGFYRLQTSLQNAPTDLDCSYSQMIVSRGSDTILQIIGKYGDNRWFVRTGSKIGRENTTWTSWQELASKSDIPSVINNLTSTSTTDALSAAQGKALNDNKLDKISASGLGTCSGGGNYSYFKLATLTVTNAYVNRPIVFEVSRRGWGYQRLIVIFNSTSNTDPALGSFGTDGNIMNFWIYKSAASTWEIYGGYNETHGHVALHRITGSAANNGVSIAINLTNVSAVPSGATGVGRYWNALWADSAGAVAWSNVTGKTNVLIDRWSETKPINLNNTDLVGNYFLNGANCSNLPTNGSADYYSVQCYGHYQIAQNYSNGGVVRVYQRQYTNNQWYAWVDINGKYEIIKYDSSSTMAMDVILRGCFAEIKCLVGNWYNSGAGGAIRYGSASGAEWVIPARARPIQGVEILDAGNRRITIGTDGKVCCATAISNVALRFSGMWIVA